MQMFVRFRWSCVLIVLLLLHAVQADAQSVTLAWDPNTEPNIGGYLIGFGTSPGQDQQLIDVGGATLWTINGVSEGATYYFRVYAYSTDGLRSAPSADLSATISGGAPVTDSSPGGCSIPDPFVSIGGGTCSNGAWTPPGFGSSNPPATPPSTPPSSPPSSPPSFSAGCSGADPFASLGGGTCVDGGWLPPGMAHANAAAASASGCAGRDPFVSLGGGTCVNGGWLPPGMPGARAAGCLGTDPFVSLGGGTCSNGSWLPPGMVLSSGGAGGGGGSSTAPSGCSIADPFVGISGLIGVCQNGGWRPVPGVSTTGTVRVFTLSETFWGIQGDDGRVYRPSSLEAGMQVQGLQVAFQGTITDQVMIPSPVSLVTLRQIVVR